MSRLIGAQQWTVDELKSRSLNMLGEPLGNAEPAATYSTKSSPLNDRARSQLDDDLFRIGLVSKYSKKRSPFDTALLPVQFVVRNTFAPGLGRGIVIGAIVEGINLIVRHHLL